MPVQARYRLLIDWNNDGDFEDSSLTLSGNEITDATRLAAVEGDGRTSPDSSMGIWNSRTNLHGNGGVETDLTGYGGTNATLARITTDKKFGTACVQATGTGVNPHFIGGVFALAGATAGRTFTASHWVKGIGSAIGKTIRIQFNESGGASAASGFSADYTLTGDWQRLVVTGTVVQNDRTDIVPYSILAGGSGDVWLLDGWQVEESFFASPYKHTDGASATRGAPQAVIPSGLLSSTQGWIALRLRVGFPSIFTSDQIGYPILFSWIHTVSPLVRIVCFWLASSGYWAIQRDNTISVYVGSAVDSFATGDKRTVVFAWTATEIKVTFNGQNFVTLSNTDVFTTSTQPEIGRDTLVGNTLVNSDVLWACGGTGTLTNANAAAIHAFGDTDPALSALPGTATFVWNGESSILSAGSAEDVTDDIDGQQSLEWTTGRDTAGSPTAQASAGTLSCTLINDDGRYSSFNAASPLYGQIVPGRRVKLQAVYSSTIYTLWCGYLANVLPSGSTAETPRATLMAHGALAKLNQTKQGISHAGSVGVTTGDVIDTILDSIDWPVADRQIDGGETTIDIAYWSDSVTPLEAMREMEELELGFLNEATDSFDVVFESRHHRLKADHRTAVRSWLDPSTAGQLDYLEIAQDDALQFIFNRAKTSIIPRTISQATVLWTYQGGDPELLPGQTFRVIASYTPGGDSVLGWETPTISTNPGADIVVLFLGGFGEVADYTTDLVVTSTPSGSQLEIVIQNVSATHRWLIDSLQARGQTVEEGSTAIVSAQDDASITKYGLREWPGRSRFVGTLLEAQAQVETIIHHYKEPRPIITWTHLADLDANHMVAALTLKLSDRVKVQATGSRTKLGIDKDFFIEGIRHRIEGLHHLVQFIGSPTNAVDHHYWILGTGKLGDSSGLDNTRLAGW